MVSSVRALVRAIIAIVLASPSRSISGLPLNSFPRLPRNPRTRLQRQRETPPHHPRYRQLHHPSLAHPPHIRNAPRDLHAIRRSRREPIPNRRVVADLSIQRGCHLRGHLRGHLLAHPRRRGPRGRRRGIAAERIRHRGAPRVATILVKPRTIQQLAPIAIPQHQFRHSRHHEFHLADPRARVHRRLPRGRDAHRSRRLVHPNFQTLYVETRRIEPRRPHERRWQTAVARRERVAAAQRGDPEIQPYARATLALLTARRGDLRHVAQK